MLFEAAYVREKVESSRVCFKTGSGPHSDNYFVIDLFGFI